MLRVVQHLAPVILQKTHGLRDQRLVLLLRDAQRACRVKIPALAENAAGRRLRLNQRAHVRVAIHRVLREPRGPKRGETRMVELLLLRAPKKLPILRIGARPTAFDVVNANLVQPVGNHDLVIN